MSKHTPGPWRVGPPGAIVSDSRDWLPQHILAADNLAYYGGYLIGETICNPANARLIAMAPEMYAMLEMTRQKHTECEDSWYSCPKSEDACANGLSGTDCNCGADAWNEALDAMLARVEQ